MSDIKTKLTSQTSRAGLALLVISFLLSLVPFQGKNLTTSKERTSAQTEVVVKSNPTKKRSFSFASFIVELPSTKIFSFQLAEIHTKEVNICIKNLARNLIPIRKQHLQKTVFSSETEDHIIA